jgi:transposase
MSLNGIGPAIAAVMPREVYYRQFENRRQVAGFLGLATSPHDSGDVERSQGISRAGRGHVRGTMIQAAWLWLKHQPKSAITRWFVQRTAGQSGRIRRIMIIAVARKLAIALWRFLEQGPRAARCHARQPVTILVA